MAYLGNPPAEAYTNTVKDSFSGDGSTVAFTMSLPTTTNNVRVVVENVIQDPTVAYSCSGTTLTFTSAPPSGTNNIYVVHLGPAVMTTVPPTEITEATTYTSDLTVQGAFTSQGIDDNADATAITIDSSENVLVGTTSANPTSSAVNVAGQEFSTTGGVRSTVASNPAATFNRKTDDGDIVIFRKDGTTVGSISVSGGNNLQIASTAADHAGLGFGTHVVAPLEANADSDGTINLGASNARFQDLYLSGGVYVGGTGSSNFLNDYEEGTWTPAVQGSPSNPGTYTYAEQQGHYVKIGEQVTAFFNITNITTSSAGSGQARITGLPFAADWQSGFNGEATGIVGVTDFSGINGEQTFTNLLDGTSTILLYHFTGTDNNVDTIDIQDKASNSADLRGMITYYTGG